MCAQRPDDNQGSIYDETLCYFCSDGGDEGNLIVCDREGEAFLTPRICHGMCSAVCPKAKALSVQGNVFV